MIALLEAYRAGLFKRQYWLSNLVSGLIVGIVALPLAMAFAIASGAKPEQGLYTAIVAGALVSMFGGSRLQIAGPTGAFIVILAGITAKYGIDGLQTATLMAGIILMILGITKLGTLIKYIPAPVIIGFTAGIAVIIWVGQWKDFFGLPAITGEHFHEKFWHVLQALPHFHLTTTLLASLTLVLVLFSPKLPGLKRIPGPLIALLIVTAIQAFFQFEHVATIGSAFGGIPLGLPTFQLPNLSFARMLELIGPAFSIAMLGAIESLLSAVIADGMAGTRHNSNQELIGQGIANIAAPLFGGFAATGAIARTATNIRNGATGPLSGVIHAATLFLIILFLAPLAAHIPLAVLAAILFVVAWNMSEAKHFIKMIRCAPRADVMLLLITFTLTVFTDLVLAVNLGVMLAALHFLYKMGNSVEIRPTRHEDLSHALAQHALTGLPSDMLVYTIDGPFFFAAVENFEQALAQTHTDPKLVILHLRWVPLIDITAMQTLEEVIVNLQKRDVRVMLAGANSLIEAQLQKVGLLDLLGSKNYFPRFEHALSAGIKMMDPLREGSPPACAEGDDKLETSSHDLSFQLG
jgi:SulP family sulfate permease